MTGMSVTPRPSLDDLALAAHVGQQPRHLERGVDLAHLHQLIDALVPATRLFFA
jgi:hypothetical protein